MIFEDRILVAVDMTNQEKQEGLWRNCEDSIRHGCEHFSAGASQDEPFHHHKWAVLSVAHAAEVYGNLLLCVFDPKHPPKEHYPSLDGVRNALLKHSARLSPSERRVFGDVLATLAGQRNTLMHMPTPEKLVIAGAAIALLSLLHIVQRRTGFPTEEFFDQHPPVEQDILDHMGWREQERWFRAAECLVASEYGEEYLRGCDNCGSFAVPSGGRCQACFQEAQH